MTNRFEQLVGVNWSRAVAEASARFGEYEADVRACLKSADPEVRSTAVAAATEAKAAKMHALVSPLLQDQSDLVRGEVLEYLDECGLASDAPALLGHLRSGDHSFLAYQALKSISGCGGPAVLDDDSPEEKARLGAEWERLLAQKGLLP